MTLPPMANVAAHAAGVEHVAWGDNSVRGRRSYRRDKGPGTSAGAFPMALSLSAEEERIQWVLDGVPRGPTQGPS